MTNCYLNPFVISPDSEISDQNLIFDFYFIRDIRKITDFTQNLIRFPFFRNAVFEK